jgi:hypothetical protein
MPRDPGGYRFIASVAAAVFAVAASLEISGLALLPLHQPLIPKRVCRIAHPAVARMMPAHFFWLSRAFQPGDARLVDVVAAGDVMMGSRDQGLNPLVRDGADISTLLGSALVGIFRRADVAFVNLEGPLYDGEESSSKDCSHCYAFRSPTAYAKLLAQLGVRAVSLANNHSGDYGETGRASTMAALRASHIGFFGLDRDDARTAEIPLANGGSAAILSFAPNSGTLDINDLDAEARIVTALKRTHTVVIVSFHGGGEGENYEHVTAGHAFFDGEDRGDVMAFAHNAVDAGADVVIGQGPHVPRALELYRGHLIAYSLGNFWTYGAIDTSAQRGAGPVIEAWLAPDGTVAGFAIHSTEQRDTGLPALDPSDDASRRILALTRDDFPATAAVLAPAEHGGDRTALVD